MAFIGISYAGHGIYVKKPETWDELLRTVSQRFKLSAATVASLRVFYSSDMSGTSPRWDLDASAWPGVKSESSVYLEEDEKPQDNGSEETASAESDNTLAVGNPKQKHVCITVDNGRLKISFELKKDTRFEKLFTAVPNQFNVKPGEFRLLFEGHLLHDNDTPAQLEMYDYETVELYLVQRGGKPAIYLLSATPLEMVTVSVSLQPEWDFAVIYPLTTKTKHASKLTSEITWVVSVQTDGTLVNRLTGRQSSYLFWEAITIPSHMLHLSPSDERGPTFHPANPLALFTSSHTIVTLPFETFEPYLDSVLEILTLTPAMRTEFIVYWLPSFQNIRDRGHDIQFTFVPQDAFNKAATLTISGAVPKAVARVFMLFRGVNHDCTKDYDKQHEYGTKLPSEVDWASVVGLDVDGMKDESAFRVLEWGGMEVTMTIPN